MTPILVLGAGRMGGALIEGWIRASAVDVAELILRDPAPGEAAQAAVREGARLNPPEAVLAEAQTVVLAVKPQIWREVAAEVAPRLHTSAALISVAAGVTIADLTAAFGDRPIARVMPTTAAAVGKGAAAIVATDADARARAHALFEPVGVAVDLTDEALMDAATAVSGSAPAYFYAFIEAIEAAGIAQGLPPKAAAALIRATLIGAAALLDQTGGEPADLRRQVTSPGGTTQAALEVLMGDAALEQLVAGAVDAAVRRSRELER
jgi:pyrroline-5-carboxylate reductase